MLRGTAHLLGMHLSLAWALSCYETESSADFNLPGDYLLAGLLPLHGKCQRMTHRPQVTLCDRLLAAGGSQDGASHAPIPDTIYHVHMAIRFGVEEINNSTALLPNVTPGSFNGHGYHLFQAIRFGVEEINNSTALLPNVTLGYELYDVCSDSANVYATLRVLSRLGTRHVGIQGNLQHYVPKVVAVVGPDTTQHAVTTAAVLGPFLVPLISYEASSTALSGKPQYPSFLRTIPSDKHQVQIMLLLLQSFGWVWVSLLASDDYYGQLGVQALVELATPQGVCVAYKDTVPSSAQPGDQKMQEIVANLIRCNTTVVVVYSSRQMALVLFRSVVLANLTGKVWIASEDWAISTHISGLPGIRAVGTVLGVAIQQRLIPGLRQFEEAYARAHKVAPGPCLRGSWCSANQLCQDCQAFTEHTMPTLGAFSMSAAYNAYRAVYAVAHGLHRLLGCASGVCSKGQFYPWQLLEEIRNVNFPLHEDTVMFDDIGDPRSGYDIVAWDWSGPQWAFTVIGSFVWSSVHLDIDKTKIQWPREDNQVPPSVCSSDCLDGHQRVIVGFHHCCFLCVPCEAGTFLNVSDPHSCQPCGQEEWSPEGSSSCFPRTVAVLTWDEPISWVLLTADTLLLLLLLATAGLFAWHFHTPVVRSAGGSLGFLMLGSLAVGSCSLLGSFGEPTPTSCLLQHAPHFLGFSVFLSCLTIRSFQLVIIFKFSTKVPPFYHTWAQNHGAGLFVAAGGAVQLLICLMWLAVWTPVPVRDYGHMPQLVLLECTQAHSVGFMLAFTYNIVLSACAFTCSYLGKELPENYNEAKCVTCSLLLNFVSWVIFFTMVSVYRGKYLSAVRVLTGLISLSSGFSGYFLPKCYVILCRPDLNTTQHFQASIQDYTRRCGSS